MIKREKRVQPLTGVKRWFYYVDFNGRDSWYTLGELSEFKECVVSRATVSNRIAESFRRSGDSQFKTIELVLTTPVKKLRQSTNPASRATPPADFKALDKLWKPTKK